MDINLNRKSASLPADISLLPFHLRDCKKLPKCHLLTRDNADQWVLLIRPPLKAWATGLVAAAELPAEWEVSEYLLLALSTLMRRREVRP